jgi:transcriptional regulator with XRE-family HTH domain
MSNDFVTWLTGELNKRGWTGSELARRAGVGTSTISYIISQQRNPGWDFCASVAQAFGLSADEVFRKAGLLPPLPPEVTEEKEVIRLLRSITAPERRRIVLDILYGLARQSHQSPFFEEKALLTEDDVNALTDVLRPVLMDKDAWARYVEWYSDIFGRTPEALLESLIYEIGQTVVKIIRNREKEGNRASAPEEPGSTSPQVGRDK